MLRMRSLEYELLDYEGHVAVASEWTAEYAKPMKTRLLWVFKHMKSEGYGLDNYLPGKHIGNNVISFYNKLSWTYLNFDTNGIAPIQQSEEIKPPGRGGKKWRWKWDGYSGMFKKEYV